MLSHGIIKRSNSEWAAPMVIVKKKDGTLRICVDYQRLNAKTCGDAYPMPRISDLIDQLGAAKYITTLDLTKGIGKCQLQKKISAKLLLSHHSGGLNLLECHLVSKVPQLLSSV